MFKKKMHLILLWTGFFLILTGLAGFTQQVDQGGNLSYTCPIAVPPGTGGMQPDGEKDDNGSYKFFIYPGNKDGKFTHLGSYDTNIMWQKGNLPTHFLPGDYNGDGRTDLIMARGNKDACYKFYMYLGNEDGMFTCRGSHNTNEPEKSIPAYFLPGDYNGDGITDLVMAGRNIAAEDRYKFFIYLGSKGGD